MGKSLTGRKIYIDNTVLTNFALVGRPDLILSLWSDIPCTTISVMEEYQIGLIVTGTVGILIRCVKKGLIGRANTQTLLESMIAKN